MKNILNSPRKQMFNNHDRLENRTELRPNGNCVLTMINRFENLSSKAARNHETKNVLTLFRNQKAESKNGEFISTPRSHRPSKNVELNDKSSNNNNNNTNTNNNAKIPNTINIYIKNESKVSNYFCKEDFKQPVIMSSSKHSSTFRDKTGSTKPTLPKKPSDLVKVFSEKYSKNGTQLLTRVYTSQEKEESMPNYTKLLLKNNNNDKSKEPMMKEKVLPSYLSAQHASPRLNNSKSFNSNNHNINNNININNNEAKLNHVVHRRKLDKDTSDEYTSFNNSIMNEIAQISEAKSLENRRDTSPKKLANIANHSRMSPLLEKNFETRTSSSSINQSKLAQLRHFYHGAQNLKRTEAIRRPKLTNSPKFLENKMVQTDLKSENITATECQRPPTPKIVEKLNFNPSSSSSNSSASSTSQQNRYGLPKLKIVQSDQINYINSKKLQDSSNFSLIKGMNSNELGNYIDNVIQNFRKKNNLYDAAIVENKELKAKTFYPESEENYESNKIERRITVHEKPPQAPRARSSLNRNLTTQRPVTPILAAARPLQPPPKPAFQRTPLLLATEFKNLTNYKNRPSNDAETVLETNDLIESRTLSSVSQKSNNKEIEEDAASFINFTQSVELDDDSCVAQFAAAEMNRHQNFQKFNISSVSSCDEDADDESVDEETQAGADSELYDDDYEQNEADEEIRRLEERNELQQLKDSSYINSEQFDRSI